jgi:hypothetical protein
MLLYTMITLHTLLQEALKKAQKFQEIATTLYRTTTSDRGPEETEIDDVDD